MEEEETTGPMEVEEEAKKVFIESVMDELLEKSGRTENEVGQEGLQEFYKKIINSLRMKDENPEIEILPWRFFLSGQDPNKIEINCSIQVSYFTSKNPSKTYEVREKMRTGSGADKLLTEQKSISLTRKCTFDFITGFSCNTDSIASLMFNHSDHNFAQSLIDELEVRDYKLTDYKLKFLGGGVDINLYKKEIIHFAKIYRSLLSLGRLLPIDFIEIYTKLSKHVMIHLDKIISDFDNSRREIDYFIEGMFVPQVVERQFETPDFVRGLVSFSVESHRPCLFTITNRNRKQVDWRFVP